MAEKHESSELNRNHAHTFGNFLECIHGVALLVADAGTGMIVDANPRARALTGYSLDELKTMHYRQLHPPESMEQVQADFEQAVSSSGLSRELTFRTASGEDIVLEINAAGSFRSGSRTLTVGVFLETTERKRAEEEREKLQAQLHRAQKLEAVGRLAGGVAHDFNNILGAVQGFAELAITKVDPSGPLHRDLGEILRAAGRGKVLTRQLLAFSRKQVISPEVLDLNEAVEGMLKMLRRIIGEEIDLVWLPGEHLEPVEIDPAQIDQILANLCVNARDAITSAGKVTLRTGMAALDEPVRAAHEDFVPGKYVFLAVSDDGCGMDRETLASIFEPFFTTKEAGKGTGLGLPTVYGAVKQSNGFIDVRSEPGEGTTFTVYLPRHVSRPEAEPTEAAGELPAGRGETVLLVEDEPAIMEVTRTMLHTLGYKVLAATVPGEALRLAGEYDGRIDLLVTDVVMPGMNGRELAARVLALHPKAGLLFMSGYAQGMIDRSDLLEAGGQFIEKPFSMKDLAAAVRRALGHPDGITNGQETDATIFVVEDDDSFREVLRRTLEEAGYRVAAAANGREAMKLFRIGPSDVVITDLFMPEMDGLETIMELRKRHPETRIIAISGGWRDGPDKYLQIARSLGASRILEKPIERETLLRVVREVLNERLTQGSGKE